MKIKNTIFFLIVIVQIGCSDNRSDSIISTEKDEELELIQTQALKETLKDLALEIESRDTNRIQSISTEKGYSSLLFITDSLRNDSFIKKFTQNLKNYKVADINEWNDSMFVISLGNLDDLVGATGGYVVIKKTNSGLRIDEYRGGK